MTTTPDYVVGVHHETTIKIKITSHKTDIALIHEIEITRTEVLLLNIVLNTDHALIQEITNLQDIHLHLDLFQGQEILEHLDTALILRQETKSIEYKLSHKTILSNLKHICITLQKWLML